MVITKDKNLMKKSKNRFKNLNIKKTFILFIFLIMFIIAFIFSFILLNQKGDNIFISVWDSSNFGFSEHNQIKLPLEKDGKYDFIVKGNNLIGSPIRIQSYEDSLLNFSTAGIQRLYMEGIIIGWNFKENGDKNKLLEIKQWGSLKLGNNGAYFSNVKNLVISATDPLNLKGTTNLSKMFKMLDRNNGFKVTGDINNWNTENITDMSFMFYRNTEFNSNINNWNVSNVKNMQRMFSQANIFNQPLNNWDISNVKNLVGTFQGSLSFNQPLDNWNTKNVINMNGMFSQAKNFNQDISCWNVKNIKEEPFHFSFSSKLNNDFKPLWGSNPEC